MKKIILLYYYPKQFIFFIVLPVVFCLIYSLFSNLEVYTIKWILYFGFCLYFGFIAFKFQEKDLEPIELDLLELQSIYYLLDDIGIEGTLLKIDKEISVCIVKQNNQYHNDIHGEELV